MGYRNMVIFLFVIKLTLIIPKKVDWISQLEAGSVDDGGGAVCPWKLMFLSLLNSQSLL